MKKSLLIIVLLAFACAGPFRQRSRLSDGPIAFQTILAGSHSLADTASVVLIKSYGDWEKTWMLAKGRMDPLPDIPTVDFKRQYVIAAFMGRRPSSGYRVEIQSIVKNGNILEVYLKKYETPGMLTVVTSPYFLARIPRGNYKIEVIEEIVE